MEQRQYLTLLNGKGLEASLQLINGEDISYICRGVRRVAFEPQLESRSSVYIEFEPIYPKLDLLRRFCKVDEPESEWQPKDG